MLCEAGGVKYVYEFVCSSIYTKVNIAKNGNIAGVNRDFFQKDNEFLKSICEFVLGSNGWMIDDEKCKHRLRYSKEKVVSSCCYNNCA